MANVIDFANQTLDEVLETNGGSHEVLIIGGDKEVHTTCQITDHCSLAEFDEMDCGVTTLQCFVKASAWSLVNDSKSDELIMELIPREKNVLSKSKAEVTKESVKVPQLAIN